MKVLKPLNNTSSFSKTSILFFSANVISFLLSFLSTIFLARVLGPSGKGALSLILLIPTFAFTFASLGIHQANIYFLGQHKDKSHAIISNATIFALLTGGLFAILVWILRGTIASWLSLGPYISALGLSCLLFPLVLANNLFINILIGQKRFKERNVAYIINSSLNLLLIILLVYFWRIGVLGGVLSLTIAIFLATLYSFLKVTRNNLPSFSSTDFSLFKKTATYGVKSQLGNIFQVFNYRLDMFFVNYFLGVAGVGIYSIAVGMGELLWYISTVTGTILFPMVSNDFQKHDDQYISSVCRKTSILMASGALAILLTGWFLIPLFFGEKFIPSVTPLAILLPGIVAIGIHKVLIFALMGKGYPQYMSYSGFITLTFTVVLDLVLIPMLGVPGAALASTLSYIICTICTSYWYMKTTQLSWAEIIIPRKEDVVYFWNYGNGVVKKYYSKLI